MQIKINQRSADTGLAPAVDSPPRDDQMAATYYRDLDQMIRECEERAAQQARQKVSENRPTRSPYGFDEIVSRGEGCVLLL